MWINDHFGVEKPILAMCHIRALPTDPEYDKEGGMEKVIECARKDLNALQDGGVDGIIFSNEFSIPYVSDIRPVTLCAMTRVISEIRSDIKVPFGTNIISSVYDSLDMAVATGATFVRGPMTGSFVSIAGSVDLNPGEIIRHKYELGGEDIKILSYIIPEGCDYTGKRPLGELAQIAEFRCKMDAICVAGANAGSAPDTQDLYVVKKAVKHTPVFVNTGCRVDTIVDQLKAADGAIVATTFKYDGIFENLVDKNRVKEFMDVVKEYRKSLK